MISQLQITVRYLSSFNWSEIFSRSFTVEDSWQVFTGIFTGSIARSTSLPVFNLIRGRF